MVCGIWYYDDDGSCSGGYPFPILAWILPEYSDQTKNHKHIDNLCSTTKVNFCTKGIVQVLRKAVNEVSVANPKITRFGILLPIKKILKILPFPFSLSQLLFYTASHSRQLTSFCMCTFPKTKEKSLEKFPFFFRKKIGKLTSFRKHGCSL